MMDLPRLIFKPGLGVQTAIRHCFDELVNFFPRRVSRSSLLLHRLVAASSSYVKTQLASFFKQP
jgi:hypothetical protein